MQITMPHAQLGSQSQKSDSSTKLDPDQRQRLNPRWLPHASGAFLLNFLDQEDDAVIRASFGSNYDRLAALKRKYDPENFFRQNQNIRPAP